MASSRFKRGGRRRALLVPCSHASAPSGVHNQRLRPTDRRSAGAPKSAGIEYSSAVPATKPRRRREHSTAYQDLAGYSSRSASSKSFLANRNRRADSTRRSGGGYIGQRFASDGAPHFRERAARCEGATGWNVRRANFSSVKPEGRSCGGTNVRSDASADAKRAAALGAACSWKTHAGCNRLCLRRRKRKHHTVAKSARSRPTHRVRLRDLLHELLPAAGRNGRSPVAPQTNRRSESGVIAT